MSFESLVLYALIAFVGVFVLVRLINLALIEFRKRKPISIEQFVSFKQDKKMKEQYYPVRYCSQDNFGRVFRILPWEAHGVLIVSGNGVKFFGRSLNGKNLGFDFEKDELRINLVEERFLRDGGLSWFEIEADDQRHYFATEGGLSDLSSPASTTSLYEAVSDLYIEDTAPGLGELRRRANSSR